MIVNDTSRLLLNKIDYMSLHYRIPWYAYLLRPIGYFIMGTAGFSLYELYTVPFDKHFEWQVPVAFGALYCVSGIVTISFGDQKTIRFKYH